MSSNNVIAIQPHQSVLILAVQRRALDAATTDALEVEVNAAVAAAPGQPVVLDMSKVEFAPSVALGTLLRLAQDLKFFGRRLIMVGVTQKVRGTLQVTRVDKLLEIQANVADALMRLGGAAPA
ncbi:MAG TPA: STAS domain-containing protein [Phycisphaerae bacterium]|jgi:anti-anti-sigma factor